MNGTLTKRQARVNWLLDHQHIWRDCWPLATQDYLYKRFGMAWTANPCVACVKFRCVSGMKAAGLISPATNWFDVNMANYIELAQHQLGVFN